MRIFKRAVAVAMLLSLQAGAPGNAVAESAGEKLVKERCTVCHRLSGAPESKFKLQAPDLIWAGNKYQKDWLLRYLTGKEEPLYPNGYRWDHASGKTKHPELAATEAEAVATYFAEKLLDARVKKNAIDLSRFNSMEAEFGKKIYTDFACIGCHQVREGDRKVGGPISVTLYGAGRRYDVDWLYRFALNPQDFTPHSGEYLADLSGLGVRYLIGYLMTLGVENVKYDEPWKSEYFQKASAERGEKFYKIYCTQCHGLKGGGDGPGAAGLDPKPAVHASMPLSEMPEDYLYFIVYYGGKSMGKSPAMPDWGLTLPPQDLADLIAYLRKTFKGQ